MDLDAILIVMELIYCVFALDVFKHLNQSCAGSVSVAASHPVRRVPTDPEHDL